MIVFSFSMGIILLYSAKSKSENTGGGYILKMHLVFNLKINVFPWSRANNELWF